MAQERFKARPDVTAPYGTTNNKQARGSDGSLGYDGSSNFSYRTNASGGATADQNLGNNDGIGTNDDVSLPKLYHYEIVVSGITNSSNEGTLSDVESEDSSIAAAVTSAPLARQVERGNMRFGAIIENLGLMSNLYEFRVETSGINTSGGTVGSIDSNTTKYHAYYEAKPHYPDGSGSTLTHDAAVKRAVATAIATARTETRHIWYTNTDGEHGDHNANTHWSPAQKITPLRESVTAAAISDVATLEAAGGANVAVTVAADSATT